MAGPPLTLSSCRPHRDHRSHPRPCQHRVYSQGLVWGWKHPRLWGPVLGDLEPLEKPRGLAGGGQGRDQPPPQGAPTALLTLPLGHPQTCQALGKHAGSWASPLSGSSPDARLRRNPEPQGAGRGAQGPRSRAPSLMGTQAGVCGDHDQVGDGDGAQESQGVDTGLKMKRSRFGRKW